MAEQDLEREYADIKAGVEGAIGDVPSPSDGEAPETVMEGGQPTENVEAPAAPSSYNYNTAAEYGGQQAMDSDRIHQIVEAIVSEKFDDIAGGLGDLTAWKEKVNHDVVSIKQELLRVEERFDNLQNAILGKVKDYDEGIRNIGTEMKALEKVFEKIMEPLITNVKELSKITEDLKKGRK